MFNSSTACGLSLACDAEYSVFETADAQGMAELERRLEQLKDHLRIGVVFGGDKAVPGSVVYKAGNTRSWKSYEVVASDIAESLRKTGFRHVSLMPDDMTLGENLRREGIHMAWLNTAGVQGYNPASHAPAMLEMLGVPYVGHDPLTATTLDNKHAFKREAACVGLPTAAFVTWHMSRGPFLPALNSRFHAAFGDFEGPFVVKPVSGRASLHVHVVPDRASLTDAVAEVYKATQNLVLIEKFIGGREFCIAVAGPVTANDHHLCNRSEPFTFAALERRLAADEKIFTSMDVKPITGERIRYLDPVADSIVREKLYQIGCDVFREFNLSTLVRIDLRADEEGNMFILEANPKPDLKRSCNGVTSLIEAGLPEAGMNYDDLVLSLLADRFYYLFNHRSDSIRHISDLIGCDGPLSRQDESDRQADIMVAALRKQARLMRTRPVRAA
jgi:D-alanine-D-alanine ligase